MASVFESTVWPSTPIASEIKDLIAHFFRLVDLKDGSVGQTLAEEVFTSDATLIGGGGTFSGKDEIKTCRANAWNAVIFRHHAVDKVFVSGSDGKDIVVTGKMKSKTKDSPERMTVTEFAARIVIDANTAADGPRMKSYQAWVGSVSSA
ncbi:uncharacterized protein Z518_08724 [Rhinocladiella mackenziei CBS 650.93]|uniref:SnoaL-like domain-containing protein n=1 Tax=Rhinocladiella mackenziei CBS 650.93 TaxID=1442369 RepID=A0A0D2FLC6_9EURO|nr:uncharacterized protein Z518_08724 [Rhinocladiella mackenziei CBS 650.93]KIX02782.1 hypothetical protein Z518_08724 [Rhinocladiella mackenziei CBS 650.93]